MLSVPDETVLVHDTPSVTLVLTQAVVLQLPSARTKYVVVVAAGETEMLAPEPTNVPPHEPLYHWYEAAVPRLPPDSDSVDEPPLRTMVGDADALVGAVDCVESVTGVLTQPVVLAVPSART